MYVCVRTYMFVYIIQLEIIDSDKHILLNYLLTNFFIAQTVFFTVIINTQ